MRSRIPALLAVCLVVCGSAAAADMNFPAQPLGESLRALGNQTKTNLLFDPKTVKNLKAPAVSNASDVAQALSQMLAGTGLTYRFIDARTVTLVPMDARKTPANSSGSTSPGSSDDMHFARVDAPAQGGAAVQGTSPAATSSEEESSDDGKEMVVTGSRVRTSKSASNVIVLTSDELKKQGLNTVEDIIRFLPQNFSTINAASALDNSINTVDARGQSAADLRGLGPENTPSICAVWVRIKPSSSSTDAACLELRVRLASPRVTSAAFPSPRSSVSKFFPPRPAAFTAAVQPVVW